MLILYRGSVKIRFVTLVALTLWLNWGQPSPAQEAGRPVIRVPWAGSAGFGFVDPDGAPRSFFIDLAHMVAEEAGFDIQLVEYPSPPEASQSIRDGETDMLAGAGRMSFSDDIVVRAGPVAQTQFLLFVRRDAPLDMSFDTFDGDRIGVLRRSPASRIPPPEGVEVIGYEDQVIAFGKLLGGEVDGVIALSPLGLRTLGRTGLDTLIRPSFPAIRETQHFVVLRHEHAHLLPRIETALAKLEEDGSLDALRNRWFMVPPAPIPDVLKVGITHFPPYSIVGDDGAISGFAVEVLGELASRAGLDLRYEVISQQEWGAGPRLGAFDLLPARSVTAVEQELLQFTAPIQTIDYVAFVRAEDAGKPLPETGDRIGILATSPLRDEIARALGTQLVPLPDTEASVAALRESRVDVLIYPRSNFERFVAAQGESAAYARLPSPVFRNDLSIAMRPDLGPVRDHFDVVIQGFIGTAQYRAMASRWFDEPPFWTEERIRRAWTLVIAVIAAVGVAILALILRGRRRALRHAEAMESLSNRLATILNTARSGILGFNPSGEIAIANTGARQLVGLPVTEGRCNWPEDVAFVDPETLKPLDHKRDPISRSLTGATLTGELSVMQKGGDESSIRYVNVSSSPVHGAPIGDISTVLILDDITEQEKNRQAVERAGRLDALGRMTGGIAHDFNNMLATIEFAATLAQDQITGKPRDYLASILNTVRRGSELTGRLLTFASRRNGAEVSASVDDFMAEFRKLADLTIGPSVSLDYQIEETGLRVYCDIGQLENALLNLVINGRDAIKETGKGNRIIVSVRGLAERPGVPGPGDDTAQDEEKIYRYVEFSVTDNGPGMSEDVKRRATDPFFTTKQDAGGTGLGLSMVYGFVQRSDGEMRLYSETGHGTTVRMILPRGADAGGREARQTRPDVVEGEGQRILVVDDEPELLELVSLAVAGLNYDCVKARSAEEALDLLDKGEWVDLLLTDVIMPGGTGGFKLAEEVRKRFPAIPVVYMSGYTGIGQEAECTVEGAVLQKPFPPSELARVLRSELPD
ncbi:transporter substrate-binding domain-containing protein [Mameliella sediminis]|uniref:transporter substrate-binding domain-containing protein n=1 Tax=Mameliella sediminis TaxID=2836866 RepID=UPI001C48A4F4|nr:transporter substrate-binding domain-containing protein [Mameliella sediminis]MBV7396799.1 transporter substrate-binding domain-containing protein [Mameliella sediminis]